LSNQATVALNFLRLREEEHNRALNTQSLEMKTPQATKTAVLVIGGAEDKVHGREILQHFFACWIYDAHIAIIPSASREPALIGSRYLQIFEEMVPSRLISWTFENGTV